MLTVTKQFSFCYAHHLPDYKGKCSRQHGHNAVLEVTVAESVKGADYKYPSMVIDFTELKATVKPLIDFIDHYNLNDRLPEKYMPPTCENLNRWFVDMIIDGLDDRAVVKSVKLSETPTSWTEYTDVR